MKNFSPRLLVRFAAAAIGALLLSGCASVSPSPATLAMLPGQEQSFNSAGVQIAYREMGPSRAETVVLIHGLMVDADLNWSAAYERLARDFHVLAIDVRGHGQSDKPHNPSAYGANMAEDVIRLLNHEGVERAHVAGFSMGGAITLYLAAHYPERLSSVVIGGYGLNETAPDYDRHPVRLAMREALATGRSVPDILIEQNRPYANSPALRYEPILVFYEELRGAEIDPAAIDAALSSMPQLSVTAAEVAHISTPMLAASGDRDPAFAAIMALRNANNETAILLVPDQGHLTAYRDPAFIEEIAQFFARNHQPR